MNIKIYLSKKILSSSRTKNFCSKGLALRKRNEKHEKKLKKLKGRKSIDVKGKLGDSRARSQIFFPYGKGVYSMFTSRPPFIKYFDFIGNRISIRTLKETYGIQSIFEKVALASTWFKRFIHPNDFSPLPHRVTKIFILEILRNTDFGVSSFKFIFNYLHFFIVKIFT